MEISLFVFFSCVVIISLAIAIKILYKIFMQVFSMVIGIVVSIIIVVLLIVGLGGVYNLYSKGSPFNNGGFVDGINKAVDKSLQP